MLFKIAYKIYTFAYAYIPTYIYILSYDTCGDNATH